MFIRRIRIIFVSIIILTVSVLLHAQVPHLINYQGKLTDADDNPVTGSYQMIFSVYEAATGGIAIWTEVHTTVTVTEGIFNILLGSLTQLNLPFDKDYYLGIRVGSDDEMIPRKRIVSVGTAYRAEDADKLGGKSSAEYATASHLHDNRYFTQDALRTDDGSAPNVGTNQVHWNTLTGVPAGLADGVDDEGAGGTPITSVDGLTGGTITGNVTVDGALTSDRHNVTVGNTNGINVDATGEFAAAFVENHGTGTSVWGKTHGQGSAVYGQSVGTGRAVSANAEGSSGAGVWARSKNGRGGEFQTQAANQYALVAFSAEQLDTNPGLFVKGKAVITGGVSTSTQTTMGSLQASAMMAPDAVITLTGQAQLQSGERIVLFAEALADLPGRVGKGNSNIDPLRSIPAEIFSAKQNVRIIITPTGSCNGLYVAEKSSDGFTVRELMNGMGSVTFDWMAIGLLKGHEKEDLNQRFITGLPGASGLSEEVAKDNNP